MKNFIKVHTRDKEVRINKNAIGFYCKSNNIKDGTVIALMGVDEAVEVKECPNEIDAMIEGVIYDPDYRL